MFNNLLFIDSYILSFIYVFTNISWGYDNNDLEVYLSIYYHIFQGLILRQEGKIQESFELFQLCNILNPSSVENIKQMARALLVLQLL